MPAALVTGITGQDGSYLAERLVAEGVAVHGIVRPGDSTAAALLELAPEVRLHEADLTDADAIRGIVAAVAPDELYNLGGISSVAFSWEHPEVTGQVSGVAVATVLRAALELDKDVRVVQASSAEIFGHAAEAPQTERTAVRPTSPYGAAKAYAHHIVGVYREQGLHASACILYNHESPRRPDTFVTRKITRGAAHIAAGLQDVLELGNLDVQRDWGWAPDYVDALVRAARHDAPGDYVIATGVSHSVADFVEAAFAAAGLANWRDHVVVNPAFLRPVDPALQVGDASLAKAALGWEPTVDFATMVRHMVDADLAAVS